MRPAMCTDNPCPGLQCICCDQRHPYLSAHLCSSAHCIIRLVWHCRVGDVYPDNMVDVRVRMYLYRWNDRSGDDAQLAPYEVRARPTRGLHKHILPLSLSCVLRTLPEWGVPPAHLV